MRTEQVRLALLQVDSRFRMCRLVSGHVKLLHVNGCRMQETIGQALGYLGKIPPLRTSSRERIARGSATLDSQGLISDQRCSTDSAAMTYLDKSAGT